MPNDMARYTDCKDVFRAAFAAGPSVRVHSKVARVTLRCAGRRYVARLTFKGKRLGSANVPSCKHGTRVAKLKVGAYGTRVARRGRTVRVTLNPGTEKLRFEVRLRTRR
jgi:hypothetical protein